MKKLSAYIVTLNEEKRFPKTLEALSKVADEIIVVDSGSKDKTKEIAESFNCKFVYNKWVSYCDQKHFAQELCSNDYVLMLDADEVLSPELIKEIKEEKKNFKFNAYNLIIKNMNPNDLKPRMFAKKYNVVRLYNKKYANLPKDLMNKDRVKVQDSEVIGQFKNYILHYCFLTIHDAIAKYNKHSTELVQTAIKNNKHYSTLRLTTEFPRQFFKYYFIQGFFIYGSYGFTQAMILAYFRFLKIAKVIAYWKKQE